MLFVYIHTHPLDKCQLDKPEESAKMIAAAVAAAPKVGVKILGLYAAPHEHTVYGIFETNDLAALERLLVPMSLGGDADLIPVISPEQMVGPTK